LSYQNDQQKFWVGDFGDEYVERSKDLNTINEIYKKQTGMTFSEMYESFFENLDRNIKIIELACNVGLKLKILKELGFKNLYGVEINKKAYEIAKKENPDITFYNSSIEDFDSNGEKFDVVCVSGILIHIDPKNLPGIINKITSLSKKYIFGSENYSENPTEIVYRGHVDKLWKQNFANLFRELNPNLKTVKEQIIPYKNEPLEDITYLFEK
jgi:pseudaminic acid biosynthesis-associated methylase